MVIGIVGFGVVGRAVSKGLLRVGNILCHYDINDNSNFSSLIESDLVFICTPTDTTVDGKCNIDSIETTIQNLHSKNYKGVIAIKSTVIPGTTDKMIKQYPDLKICCVPEFLRAKSADDDFFINHDVLVIGSNNIEYSNLVIKAHGTIPKSIAVVSPAEAEIIKYFNNVHNALEIVFANVFNDICVKIGASYQNVLEAASLRNNINKKYLKCDENFKGFGGHCLPKDTKAWCHYIKDLEIETNLFQSILQDNERYK